jgi:hypothetical protein
MHIEKNKNENLLPVKLALHRELLYKYCMCLPEKFLIDTPLLAATAIVAGNNNNNNRAVPPA